MNEIVFYIKRCFFDFLIFIKWLLLAVLIGVVVGGIGTLFHFAIEEATYYREIYPWLLFCLPIGGILIVYLYKKSGQSNNLGTNLVLLSVRTNEHRLPILMAPLIFISTTITHLCGGSSGREGAALQLGGSLAGFIGEKLHLDEKELHIIIMCGMSAAFSALFRTPLAAAIFSMEVVSVGIMYYMALVPCVIASLIAYSLSGAFNIPATTYKLTIIPSLNLISGLQVIGLAILCAILCVFFCKVLHIVDQLYRHFLSNAYIRVIIGSILVISINLLLQTKDYLGAGMPVIEKAISGTAHPSAFLLKIILTALTLGAGFKGGEIVPAFFAGATFGCVVGPFIGLSASFASALGLIAVFCGVTNCPLTSFILCIELFGSEGALLFMLAIAVSYMLSGYSGLYRHQKMMYSKFKPEFVNQLTE